MNKPAFFKTMTCLLSLGAVMLTAVPQAGATASPSLSTPAPKRSDYYDQEGQPYSSLYFKKRAATLGISLVRMDGLEPGQFVLRLTAGDAVSGCARLSNPAYEVKFQDIYMDVRVDEYIVDMRNQTGAPHYGCNQGVQVPTVEIPLSRDDLRSRNIQRIRFNNGPFIDYYDIRLDDHRIQLLPSESERPGMARYRPQKIANVRNPLIHWFYPANTVILYVPGAAGQTPGLRTNLDAMARGMGLEPLENQMPAFKSPLIQSNYYYYVDTKGRLNRPGLSEGISIGNVNVTQAVYGMKGDEAITNDLQVFARRPGMYE